MLPRHAIHFPGRRVRRLVQALRQRGGSLRKRGLSLYFKKKEINRYDL